jgi:hypothetical protein
VDIQNALIRQINANMPKVWASPHFTGDRMWLTFYLCGLEEALLRMGETLVAAGWQNTGDAYGGWIYPFVEVDQTVDAVMETAMWVQGHCSRKMFIDLIDADTIPMSNKSTLITLYVTEIENCDFNA